MIVALAKIGTMPDDTTSARSPGAGRMLSKREINNNTTLNTCEHPTDTRNWTPVWLYACRALGQLRLADATGALHGFAGARCAVLPPRRDALTRNVRHGSSNVVARDDLVPAFAEDAALANVHWSHRLKVGIPAATTVVYCGE